MAEQATPLPCCAWVLLHAFRSFVLFLGTMNYHEKVVDKAVVYIFKSAAPERSARPVRSLAHHVTPHRQVRLPLSHLPRIAILSPQLRECIEPLVQATSRVSHFRSNITVPD